MPQERAQFGNKIEYILTSIGTAVGLGNVWRFPFLVFKHNGGPFLVPFFILLFIMGIPIFFLETAVGQFSGLSATDAFGNMAPLFQGLGYASVVVVAMIGFYYNLIIAYCLHFLVMSFRSKLLWSECDDSPNCFQISNNLTKYENCTLEKIEFLNSRNLTSDQLKSPAEIYFYKKMLDISSGLAELGNIKWDLLLVFFCCWLIIFLVLCKGIKILGKVSYFTAVFPYIILTILVIKGSLLSGAKEGVNFYILGEKGYFDFKAWGDVELWKDASSQIFFALSTCTSALISMSSFNPFNHNLVRDTFLIPIVDILTGFYAGFAIFAVLGEMYLKKCASSFKEVAAQGPELAFIVYPEGISFMGSVAPFFSILFFFMMILLGLGSEFGVMVTVMSTIIDGFKKYVNTAKKEYVARFIIVSVYFLLGLTLVTRGGFYILGLIDNSVGSRPLLWIGLFEVIVVPWVYGTTRFVKDIESMVGKYPKIFWIFLKISWKFLTPLILMVVLILSYVITEEKGPDYIEPSLVEKIIGYILEFLPLAIIFGCAIYQIIKHKKNLRVLIEPQPGYYAKRDKYLESLKNEHQMETIDKRPKSSHKSNKIEPT